MIFILFSFNKFQKRTKHSLDQIKSDLMSAAEDLNLVFAPIGRKKPDG